MTSKMPCIFGICILAPTLFGISDAYAADCGPLKLVTAFQMTRSIGSDIDLVPIDVGGTSLNFLLATGSFTTRIGQAAADDLRLSISPSNLRTLNSAGKMTNTEATIPQFKLGIISTKNATFPIAPETETYNGAYVLEVAQTTGAVLAPRLGAGIAIGGFGHGQLVANVRPFSRIAGDPFFNPTMEYQTAVNTSAADGIFGLDYIGGYDADIDFGSDIYQMISSDHCPGTEVYWKASAVAVVPIVKESRYQLHIPIELDGHEYNALIDTTSSVSTLRDDVAHFTYGVSVTPTALQMSAQDQTASGPGDVTETVTVHGVRVVEHTFHTLTIGDAAGTNGSITITNPHMVIIPYSSGLLASDVQHMTGSNIETQKDDLNVPEVTIGMNLLRKLHIYVAFKEGNMYVTEASVPDSTQSATMKDIYLKSTPQRIAALNQYIAVHPGDFQSLNDRCYARATIKIDLGAALADCDQAIKLKPGNNDVLESRAFVLYQQGNYQDALAAYDAVLAINPRQASALLLRGYTKGKLGDQVGRDADISAARADDPAIEVQFLNIDISG